MTPEFEPRFASAQAIMKAALNLRGLPGGYPRPPYLPLTDAELARTRTFLADLGVVQADRSTGRGERGDSRDRTLDRPEAMP
jgi:hypothetical protein